MGGEWDFLLGFGCADEFIDILSSQEIKFKGKILAAEILGDLHCEKAVPVLLGVIEKEKRDVRRASIDAIAKIESPQAKQILMEVLTDPDSHLRKTALAALGSMRSRSAFDLILKRIGEEEYSDVLEEAVRALVNIDANRLSSHLGEFDSSIKEAIGRSADNTEILLALSHDKEINVKLSAIASLGRIDDEKAYDRLREALDEKNIEVKRTALMALTGSGRFIDKIEELLNDQDMWVRLHAVRALSESMKPEVLVYIKNMLKDKEAPVVLAAIEAIGIVGGKEAESELKLLLNHKDTSVREAAERALGRT